MPFCISRKFDLQDKPKNPYSVTRFKTKEEAERMWETLRDERFEISEYWPVTFKVI